MDWSAFRAEFPVTTRWAFLDHAAVAPLSAPAVRALHEYAASLAGNGIAAFRHWFDRIQHVRRLAAQLINAPDPDDVYFVPNTTHGIGVVADGHKWLVGPEGAGVGYIRREWVDRLHPVGVGANSVVHPWAYSTIDFTLKPHAGRWEGGAYNVPGIAALGASLELLLAAGIEN